jgi:uncharacterized protein YajQ (UPF0234 family)
VLTSNHQINRFSLEVDEKMKVEYGHTKMFQNAEQKALYDAISEEKTLEVSKLIKNKKVKKIVTSVDGDNSDKAKKVRLRGRIRVLKTRLNTRGSKLPV